MAKIEHGINFWVKHGQMPSMRGLEKIQKYIEDWENRLIKELGGWKNITPGQEALIRGTSKALGVVMLVEVFVNKVGSPLRHDLANKGILQLHPVLEKSYLSYQNTIRLNLDKLFPDGLGQKKADDIFNVEAHISEKYGGEKEEKTSA